MVEKSASITDRPARASNHSVVVALVVCACGLLISEVFGLILIDSLWSPVPYSSTSAFAKFFPLSAIVMVLVFAFCTSGSTNSRLRLLGIILLAFQATGLSMVNFGIDFIRGNFA